LKTIYKPMILILALTVSLSSCIVSKKEYLLKEDEARSCADRLTLQVEDNKALRTELSKCQDDLASSGKRVDELTADLGSVSDERDLLQRNSSPRTRG
jgi:hypothetical protein